MLYISDSIMPIMPEHYALGTDETAALYQAPEHTQMISMCREGFRYVADSLANTGKKALLPAFTCETVIMPFKQSGWTFAFYAFDEKLRVDEAHFLSVLKEFRPDVVVAQHLFGLEFSPKELQLFAHAKEQGCFLVEDITHTIFIAPHDLFDVTVGSLRKWFPVPDGAIYRSKVLPIEKLEERQEKRELLQYRIDAGYIRGLYYSTGDPNLYSVANRIVNICEEMDNDTNVRKMSQFASRVLAREDFAENNRRRVENAKCLYRGLKDDDRFWLPYDSEEDISTGPLWFSLFRDSRNEFWKKVLLANKIAATPLWAIETPEVEVNETVHKIYCRNVEIPVGQRWTTDDMQYIVDKIRQGK